MKNTMILIKGAGEMASAVAHRLYRSGFPVIMTEVEKPLMVRRHVSFGNCVYENIWQVEGIQSELVRDLGEAKNVLRYGKIPVLIDEKCEISQVSHPKVIVDGILAKRNTGTTIDDAPIVIGLGPGFEAGKDVHGVIETMRGHNLGRIIFKGSAKENTGIPGTIQGITNDRVLRAPRAGVVKNVLDIGSLVKKGDLIAEVEEQPVTAKIDGVLRGLIHDELKVRSGQKIGDIDPRAQVDYCNTISDKGRTISGGVLEAILFFLKTANL